MKPVALAALLALSAGCASEQKSSKPEPWDATQQETHYAPPPDRLNSPMEPSSPGTDPSEVTDWTCPMHPEIHESKPGKCPKCGMQLQPADKEHRPK
ncbi:MAG: hypothetical protein K8T20_09650 [Planctomycetes bacterium]|nr:hypothetical protein [Planctomycetota bacterium]